MKTLIIDIVDSRRLGELVTAARILGSEPDILAMGPGDIPGTFSKAYRLENSNGANGVSKVADLVKQQGYEVVLLTATSIGAALAGPLAVRLSAPLLSEVIGISADGVFQRPLYGGKAVGRYQPTQFPLVVTVRRKYFESAVLESTTTAETLPALAPRVQLISEKRPTSDGVALEDAEVIVSGGRGLGGAENFSMLAQLANKLGGTTGASRGAVDEGWAPPAKQIGQTGNIVAPSVYFAVGISGASQHLAGIANAKCVVAVNKDEEANIFKRARFGVVCDYKKFIPILTSVIEGER
jgi:electron transfer flavoprotein alpha subunit